MSIKQTKATEYKPLKSSSDQLSQCRKRSSSNHSNSLERLIKQSTPCFGPLDSASNISDIDKKVDAAIMDLDDIILNILAEPVYDSHELGDVSADLKTKSTIDQNFKADEPCT